MDLRRFARHHATCAPIFIRPTIPNLLRPYRLPTPAMWDATLLILKKRSHKLNRQPTNYLSEPVRSLASVVTIRSPFRYCAQLTARWVRSRWFTLMRTSIPGTPILAHLTHTARLFDALRRKTCLMMMRRCTSEFAGRFIAPKISPRMKS